MDGLALHPGLKDVTPPGRFPVFAYRDACLRISAGDLVKGLIGSSGLVVIWGPPKSGKSFVALDLGLHIAAGRPWRGRRVRRGVVVYVAAEAGESMHMRIVAARTKFGHDGLPFFVIPVAPNMLDREDFGELVTTLRECEEGHAPIVAIFVDTLSRTAPGANENAPEDMTRYVATLDKLRQEFGCAVLAVHHSGKDRERGMRGHSALLAAVDTGVEIADGKIVFAVQRDYPGGETFAFGLEPVELGRDEEGDPIVSCIVVEREVPRGSAAKPKEPRGTNQKLALAALRDAIREHGEQAPASLGIPSSTRVVRVDLWETRFVGRGTFDPKHRKTRFREAANALAASGFVVISGEWAWLP